MTQKSLNVTWHDHLQHISGLFQDLYENKKLVDVSLYCSDGSLKAHKIVLSACSPYFAKIFQENDIQHPIIILKGITFNEMHLLLEFMYKGSVNILENELDSLIQAGSYLEIKGMDAKNIPSNMKKTAKRAAEEAVDESSEVSKKIKEHRTENETAGEDTEQVTSEETNVAIEKDETSELIATDAITTEPTATESITTESTATKSIKTESSAMETTTEPTASEPITIESTTTESTTIKIEPSHRRETRFKGQKRVDVHMFSRGFKYYDDVSSSPKHSKGKSNTDTQNKGKASVEDNPIISRFQRKSNNSPVTIKKEKQEDKSREKETNSDKVTRTFEKLSNDDVDVTYSSRINKAKLNITAPSVMSKKNSDDIKVKKSRKQQFNNCDNSNNLFEDTLSRIIIKDVYSTDDMKTSTPIKTYDKSKQTPVKTPENDKEYIPVIPDVIMNESDSEINTADNPDDEDNDDVYDNDNDNGYDDDHASDMLKVSHLECSQCKTTCKTDEEFSEHMKTHSDKPYKCDYCDSYFHRMSHLIRHRRTHTGEKPYSCRECGKCFSRQDKLKQHIRVHDENEYKPPPHLRKVYEPPLSSDERRGRGRPRKNAYIELPAEKRPRGRPRKYSLPAPGEHVENYDITNLPFGDFSYLTSPLPDFNDLTIIPVTLPSKPATAESSSSSNNDAETKDAVSDQDSQTKNKVEIKVVEENKKPIQHLNEFTSIIRSNSIENNQLSIIEKPEKDTIILPNKEVTIINLDKKENETQSQSVKMQFPDTVRHLGECTIEAVSK